LNRLPFSPFFWRHEPPKVSNTKLAHKDGDGRLKADLLTQLEELAEYAKKMGKHSTGQKYMMWRSIETKAKELIVLLKEAQ